MRAVDLPDDDHVVRYAKPTLVEEDGSVGGPAFQLRPGEASLSVHWLECFDDQSRSGPLRQVRRLSRLRLSRNGRFAELHAGRTKQHLREELEDLRFVHDPLEAQGGFEADPSHSGMRGLPDADTPEAELVGDMIAECVTELHRTAT
ncbi:hypothetical protein [Candidatus Palauibacter sp.]|uniref:hypothetical protein n=1 Tax=Candidatus Palauibacter sp. TaxID=3101350 RepID=UPI003CC58713